MAVRITKISQLSSFSIFSLCLVVIGIIYILYYLYCNHSNNNRNVFIDNWCELLSFPYLLIYIWVALKNFFTYEACRCHLFQRCLQFLSSLFLGFIAKGCQRRMEVWRGPSRHTQGLYSIHRSVSISMHHLHHSYIITQVRGESEQDQLYTVLMKGGITSGLDPENTFRPSVYSTMTLLSNRGCYFVRRTEASIQWRDNSKLPIFSIVCL